MAERIIRMVSVACKLNYELMQGREISKCLNFHLDEPTVSDNIQLIEGPFSKIN